MHAKREAGTEHGQPDPRVATLIQEATEARDDVLRQLRAENEQLRARGQFDRIALDTISQGVAIFDRDRRLILSNRRYAEIYRLTPDQITPGMTLREIVELRTAAGTCPMSADNYLAVADFARAREEVDERVISLVDGRSIRVRHAPASDGSWTSTHEDITELHEKRLLLEERLSLQSLIDATPDNLWVKDTQNRFVIANVATARRMGRLSPKELIGKVDLELCPPETAEKYVADERDVLTTGRQLIDAEEYVLSPDGAKSWIATTKTPLRNERGEIVGIVGISRDITRRRRARMLLEGQAQILEMIASRTPLDQVLDQLLRIFESQMTGVDCSIFLVDEDGNHLRCAAAPSLPETYRQEVDGILIGPESSPSGLAAYRRETVVVTDTLNDPICRDVHELAATCSLRSCSSTPILTPGGSLLGVFSMYWRTLREPDAIDRRLAEIATSTAGIAIERSRDKKALRVSEERFRTIFAAVNDAIIVHDPDTGAFLDFNPRLSEMFGYTRDELLRLDLGDLSTGESPYTLNDAYPLLKRAMAGEEQTFEWQCKAKDARRFWIEVSMRRASFGKRKVLISVARDITKRKRAEEHVARTAD